MHFFIKQFSSKIVAKIELEVGTCPTGVLLALKSVEGRVHQVTAIEMTNDEALEISKLIKQRVKENMESPEPSEIN